MASSFQGFIAILGGHPLRHHCLKTKDFMAISEHNPRFNPRSRRHAAGSWAAEGHSGRGGQHHQSPVLLDWRHCGVDLVVILHHEIDIGREFHGLRGRFQF